MNYTLDNFYTGKDWLLFRIGVISDRINDEGQIICAHCGKPIVKQHDIIAHHVIPLTEANVNNVEISLNPDNIQLVHHVCHNKIHNKLGYVYRQVYLVYGSPLSGKSTWVKENMNTGDLIVDMDNIWQCVSGCDRYIKPERLKSNVFLMRDTLLDMVRFKTGKWNNAYIIGGYPLISERERLCKKLGAREIYIESSLEECMLRLEACTDNRDKKEWKKYIEDWWEKYRPPGIYLK